MKMKHKSFGFLKNMNQNRTPDLHSTWHQIELHNESLFALHHLQFFLSTKSNYILEQIFSFFFFRFFFFFVNYNEI